MSRPRAPVRPTSTTRTGAWAATHGLRRGERLACLYCGFPVSFDCRISNGRVKCLCCGSRVAIVQFPQLSAALIRLARAR